MALLDLIQNMPTFNIISATMVPPIVMKYVSDSHAIRSKDKVPISQGPTKGRPTPSSFQTRVLPPPPGVDPTSASRDILQRVQAATNAPMRSSPSQQADQLSSCQISIRSLLNHLEGEDRANARSVAGATGRPGSTARSPARLRQSQEALYCQTQNYPGDTTLARPYQASRNDNPTIAPPNRTTQPQTLLSSRSLSAYSAVACTSPTVGYWPSAPQATRRLDDLKRGNDAAYKRHVDRCCRENKRDASQDSSKPKQQLLHLEEQREPSQAQSLRTLCPTPAQHSLSGGPKGHSNIQVQSPESSVRNDGRKKRQRIGKLVPP